MSNPNVPAAIRQSWKRFSETPEMPSAFALLDHSAVPSSQEKRGQFGPLLETDSLVARIEKIWGLTPRAPKQDEEAVMSNSVHPAVQASGEKT